MTQTNEDEFISSVEHWSTVFDELCEIKYNKVAEEEGYFQFLTKDVITQYAESMAECAVLCRKQFIKLMVLQHLLEKDLEEHNGTVALGTEAFKKAGE